MKRHLAVILTFATLLNGQAQTAKTNTPLTGTNLPAGVNAPALQPMVPPKTDYTKLFKNDKEKNSYAIGMSVAGNLKMQLTRQQVDFDLDSMVKAMKDVLGGTNTVINETQDREILNDFSKEMRAKAEAKRKQEEEKNKADGLAFLEKNKSVSGVVVLTNGLQYQIITAGTGASPKADDEVTVNYRGTLLDGTEFDNSAKHGKAFTTKVTGGIIQGWTQALKLMNTGAKWRLFIPSELAYGERGAGAGIPPNATLIFEIELLSIKSGDAASPGVPPAAVQPATPLTSDIIRVPSAEEMKKGKQIETIKAEDVNKAITNK